MWAAWDKAPLIPRLPAKTTKFSGLILEEETRKLLEYRQLVTMPKYKNNWQWPTSAGNAQTGPENKQNIFYPQTSNANNTKERHHIWANHV